jgi:hypothetical protein
MNDRARVPSRVLRISGNSPGEGSVTCAVCGFLLSEHDKKIEVPYGRLRACIALQHEKIKLWMHEATERALDVQALQCLGRGQEEEIDELNRRVSYLEDSVTLDDDGNVIEEVRHPVVKILELLILGETGDAIHLASSLDEDGRGEMRRRVIELSAILPLPRPQKNRKIRKK